MPREFIYLDEERTQIRAGEDGLPMFKELGEDGSILSETQADVFHLLDKVPALGNDLKKEKQEKKQLQDIVSVLKDKGIKTDSREDVDAFVQKALSGLSKLESFNEKDFVGTEKIEEIKSNINTTWEEKTTEIRKSYEEQIEGLMSEKSESIGLVRKLMINDKFSSSPFVREKCSAPPEVLMNCFAKNLDVDLGNLAKPHVIAKYDSGETVYSKRRAGELPDFDEALSILVNESKDRDFFLKASDKSGSGLQSGNPSTPGDFKSEYQDAMKQGNMKKAVSLKLKNFKK